MQRNLKHPYFFALTKSKLSQALHIHTKVSVVGVFHHDNTNFPEILKEFKRLSMLHEIRKKLKQYYNYPGADSIEINLLKFEVEQVCHFQLMIKAVMSYENMIEDSKKIVGLKSKNNPVAVKDERWHIFVKKEKMSYLIITRIDQNATVQDLIVFRYKLIKGANST